MKLIDKKLSGEELEAIIGEYGSYVKVTVDIENGWVVVGPELHIDAVPMLKEKGAVEENIWGGWINLENREIEMSAVWNIRPQLNNPSMEILNQEIRDKFERSVKAYFECLWM